MHLKGKKGQAMVEFALVLPILLLFLCGIIDFGWIFGNQLLATNAAREAARYTAIHYYDSSIDDDQAIADGIVADRVPTLEATVVTINKSAFEESITIKISSNVNILTPIISALFTDGKYAVKAQCTMRLE